MERSRGLVDKISGIFFVGDKKKSADMHFFYSLRVFNKSIKRDFCFSLVHWYVFAAEKCNTRMNYRIISIR